MELDMKLNMESEEGRKRKRKEMESDTELEKNSTSNHDIPILTVQVAPIWPFVSNLSGFHFLRHSICVIISMVIYLSLRLTRIL